MVKRTKKLAAKPGTHFKSNVAQFKREMKELPLNITQRSKDYYSIRDEIGKYGRSRKASTAVVRNSGNYSSPSQRRRRAK